ncbi:hypothetical protein BgiBS90_030229, partial [Biomphalaria glabrata]
FEKLPTFHKPPVRQDFHFNTISSPPLISALPRRRATDSPSRHIALKAHSNTFINPQVSLRNKVMGVN